MLDLADAYDAALNGGVWVERPPGPRLIRLTGPQRIWFLQNTITADVEGVAPGRWTESCFLDPKGRVVARFRVGVMEEEIWIDADPASGAGLAEWFLKYRFRTKVDIEPVASRCVAVFGAPASDVASDGSVMRAGDAVAFGSALAGVPVADVHGEFETSLPQGPPALYDVLRIEAGVGEFGIDFGPSDLPQEAGLTRVLSVDKGCYVGQETIARIYFRGHINKVLRTLHFDGVDESTVVGRKLLRDGSVVGSVTSATTSPRAGAVGIGMVRVEPPAGAVVDVESGGTAVVGSVPEGTKIKS